MDRPQEESPIDAKLAQLAKYRRQIVGVYGEEDVDLDLMYELAAFSAEAVAQETSTDPKIIAKAREVDGLLESYKEKHKALLEAAAEAQKSLDAAKMELLTLKKELQNDLENKKIIDLFTQFLKQENVGFFVINIGYCIPNDHTKRMEETFYNNFVEKLRQNGIEPIVLVREEELELSKESAPLVASINNDNFICSYKKDHKIDSLSGFLQNLYQKGLGDPEKRIFFLDRDLDVQRMSSHLAASNLKFLETLQHGLRYDTMGIVLKKIAAEAAAAPEPVAASAAAAGGLQETSIDAAIAAARASSAKKEKEPTETTRLIPRTETQPTHQKSGFLSSFFGKGGGKG